MKKKYLNIIIIAIIAIMVISSLITITIFSHKKLDNELVTSTNIETINTEKYVKEETSFNYHFIPNIDF